MSDELLSAAVGFAGALVGAGAAWWAAVSVSRWTRTMDLHREFNSERLSRARSEAVVFLRDNWQRPFNEISQTDTLDLAAVPLWEVVYFYERLWTLVRFRQVVRRAVPDLFGEVFLWWYTVSFRQQLLPCQWKASTDIQALFRWLKSNTPRDQWNEWVERQESSYDSMRNRASRTDSVPPNGDA